MLLRLPYLAVSSVFAFIRLLPMSAADKDIEILTPRHQLAVLQRQIDRPRVTLADRAFLAALLHRLPKPTPRQLHLIVAPETVLRWHRDLMRRRHGATSPPKRSGSPPTRRSIQVLVLRLARENGSWGCRRMGLASPSPTAAADAGLPYSRILSGAPLSKITASKRCGNFAPAATR